MTLSIPQPGIFSPTQPQQYALEYVVSDAVDVPLLVAAVRSARSVLAKNEPETSHVIAFGAPIYQRLAGDIFPENLGSFKAITGSDGSTAPATQGDILIWIQGGARDAVFDVAVQVDRAFGQAVSCALEVSGFIYHDSRDLTGFIDGTANPTGDLIAETALVHQGGKGAGGAYMLTQKWVHNLPAFNALPVQDQERVIGRTKEDSIELEGEAMPATSHVSRTDAKIDGQPLRLYRRSFPYGTVAESGLYFLAFVCDPMRFDVQLRRMFGVSEDGLRDSLIDYSTAVSGSYWFAPSLDDLEAITG